MDTAYLFDLDGTLTSVELLPLIAEELGIRDEIAQLTSQTIAGEIPFEESFRRRVGILGQVDLDSVIDIVCNVPIQGSVMDWVISNRDDCWVVTGNLDCWVNPWLAKYGLRGFSSTAKIVGGRIGVNEILRKESVLENFRGKRTVMVGDGANDAQLIASVDVGIASAIVHEVPPVVLEVADYLVSEEETLCRVLSRL